ncbi:hypothetical protein NBRC10512v2_005605 [Rhodotorula toruloides]
MDSVGQKARSSSGRQPACRTCQKRRVRCDGLKVCTACLRRAAWEGLPPPERCEYASGVAPAEASGSASASSSSSADFSTRNCAARASASGLAGSSSEAQLARFGGGTGRPLQKGLACLACKARRVRCDSARPACSSCRKTSKFKTGELQCVYRADLYLQRRKEEEAKRRLAGTVPMKEEDEDMPAAGEKVEPKEAARPAVQPVVKTEPGAPERGHPLRLAYLDQPTFSASALTDTTASAILRSACRHRRQKRVAVADFATPQSIFAPAPSPADYFTISTALRSGSISSQSGLLTNPPSPSFTISETDLSSWPSPRSPCDEWCNDLPSTYPPVPYPPALPTSDYHSLFNEACSSLFIPPLALSTPLQSLDLTDIASPLSMYSSLPPGDPLKIDSSITGMDSTLTLPFAPSFAGEWSSSGPSEL